MRQFPRTTVGAGSAIEAEEDIEISFAALEHRLPELAGRSSPAKNQDVLKKKLDYNNAM